MLFQSLAPRRDGRFPTIQPMEALMKPDSSGTQCSHCCGIFRGTALALDEVAAKALLKKSDCTKCHARRQIQEGPSYQKVAAKWKGKADAEAKLIDNITKAPEGQARRRHDGRAQGRRYQHPKEIKNLIEYILSR